MLLTFNHQHLNRFEGFAHGENYVFSRITFTEVNCMPSKFNYFVYKEQSSIGLTAEYPSTNLHKNSVYCILTRSSKNAAKFPAVSSQIILTDI